jgi:small ubiquitin-related modifier
VADHVCAFYALVNWRVVNVDQKTSKNFYPAIPFQLKLYFNHFNNLKMSNNATSDASTAEVLIIFDQAKEAQARIFKQAKADAIAVFNKATADATAANLNFNKANPAAADASTADAYASAVNADASAANAAQDAAGTSAGTDTGGCANEDPVQAPKKKILVVGVREPNGAITSFKIRANTALSKVFGAYSKRINKNRNILRFVFEGQRIDDDSTATSLGMAHGDQIDVYQEQVGGC